MSALSPAPATSSGAPWADPLTPLDSAPTDCCLSYKQNGPVSPLESALPNASHLLDSAHFETACFDTLASLSPVTPLESALTKNTGGGVPQHTRAALRCRHYVRHVALATRIGSGALQDGAQLADVLKTFDGQDFLDQSCGGGSTKNGPDQVAGFGDYFVAGHGIFRRAAYVLHPLAQLRAVGERHLDDRLAARAARVDARIGDDLHFGALPQDGGIFHARLVVDGTEGGGFVEEHYGHHVLHADVGHIAIADGIGFIAGDADDDLGDIVGGKRALLEEAGERVERSLDRRADT